MSGYILEPPVVNWICHLCGLTDVTREARVHTRMHNCVKMGGLSTPMHDTRLKVKVTVEEREDYIGNDIVQEDAEGRPIMAVVTEREDGSDRVVYAPTASGNFR